MNRQTSKDSEKDARSCHVSVSPFTDLANDERQTAKAGEAGVKLTPAFRLCPPLNNPMSESRGEIMATSESRRCSCPNDGVLRRDQITYVKQTKESCVASAASLPENREFSLQRDRIEYAPSRARLDALLCKALRGASGRVR